MNKESSSAIDQQRSSFQHQSLHVVIKPTLSLMYMLVYLCTHRSRGNKLRREFRLNTMACWTVLSNSIGREVRLVSSGAGKLLYLEIFQGKSCTTVACATSFQDFTVVRLGYYCLHMILFHSFLGGGFRSMAYFALYEIIKKGLTPAGASPDHLSAGAVLFAGGMAGKRARSF